MSQAPTPIHQPVPLGYAPPPRNDLRQIAMRQKAVMWCILGYLAAVVLQAVLSPEIAVLGALLGLTASVTGAGFVFMLAIAIYRTGAGIALGILTLIPLVGLIVLLIVNGKATRIRRENGIKVGLMGANMRQVSQTARF